jgi:hypothetical protein
VRQHDTKLQTIKSIKYKDWCVGGGSAGVDGGGVGNNNNNNNNNNQTSYSVIIKKGRAC